ncbi:MAG: sulfotransferase family protein [Chloroflexota bacterium]|nr:MAG: hypothetical protein DLM70_11895 [Chloroflexota bacterium]
MSDLSPTEVVEIEICRRPIFVVGSQRSGTTILASSLRHHGALWYSTEGYILNEIFGPERLDETYAVARLNLNRWLAREGVTREEFLERMGLGFNVLLSSRSGGKRWIEKTPENSLMIEVLGTMFPGACFIHILRDGRGAVNSMVNKRTAPGWVTDITWACRAWRRYVDAALEYAASHPDRCLTVRYEELVADPEEGFEAIYQFIGVPYDRAPMDFFRTHRTSSSFRRRIRSRSSHEALADLWDVWPLQFKRIFLEDAGVAMLRYGMVSEEEMQQMVEDARDPSDESPSWTEELEGYRSRRDLAAVVERGVPRDAVMLVVSKGDERLLELGDREAWHFPRDEDGGHPGYHPADSEEAIARLEWLRARGAEYLVFPEGSLWWLEHYTGFRDHLAARYPRVVDELDKCMIYGLQSVRQVPTA